MSAVAHSGPTEQCAVHIEQQTLRRDLIHGGQIAVKEVSVFAGTTSKVSRESKVALFQIMPRCFGLLSVQ
jgi:hypothetical protein